MRKPVMIALAALCASCSWVELTPEGENVAVLTANDVINCAMVGDTTVSVPDEVLIQRSSERVTEELRILARNAAANREGDTIVPDGPVVDGQRTYNIYQCRR